MRAPVVLAALLALASPALGRAQPVSDPTGPDTYLDVHLGAFVPQHSDLDGYDARVALGGAFGAYFDEERHLGIEAGIAYGRAVRDASVQLLGETERVTAALGVVPITASVRLRLPLGRGELHALGGGGLHLVSLRWDRELNGTRVDHGSASTSAFGFHVGAGAAFQVWTTTYVGAEVRRSVVRAKLDGVPTRVDGLTAALTLSYQL